MASVFNLVQQNKLRHTNIGGNTNKDGSGDDHHLVVSSDGHLKTSVQTDRTQDTDGINKMTGGALTDGTEFVIDCTAHRSVRIFGSTTGQLDITATNATNIGNINFWAPIETISAGIFNIHYPDPPRHLRIKNNTGGSIAIVYLHYNRNL